MLLRPGTESSSVRLNRNHLLKLVIDFVIVLVGAQEPLRAAVVALLVLLLDEGVERLHQPPPKKHLLLLVLEYPLFLLAVERPFVALVLTALSILVDGLVRALGEMQGMYAEKGMKPWRW